MGYDYFPILQLVKLRHGTQSAELVSKEPGAEPRVCFLRRHNAGPPQMSHIRDITTDIIHCRH